jgi:hypothetical protein
MLRMTARRLITTTLHLLAGRVQALVAVTLFAVLAAGPLHAACLPESKPNNTLETAQKIPSAFCIQGSTNGRDQAVFLWTLSLEDAARQWTLHLDTLPGQSVILKLQRVTLDASGKSPSTMSLLQEGKTSASTADVSLGPMIALPGTYAILVASTGNALYRLRAEAGETLTPAAAATAQKGAFRLSTRSTSDTEKVTLPWSIDEEQAQQRWTLSVQGTAGASPELQLEDASGTRLASSSATAPTDPVWLADLGLKAGAYQIVVSRATRGTVLIVSAEPNGLRQASFAEEPDDDPAHAHALRPGTPVTGRLVPQGGSGDRDVFALEVDEQRRGHRLDIVLVGPARKELMLEAVTESGAILQRRKAQGEVRLRGFVLAPGRHFVQVSGALAPEETYTLRVEDRGPVPPGVEWEPNDTPDTASPFGPGNRLEGEIDSEGDYEFARLVVAGELQLWRIQVIGDTVSRLHLLDPNGLDLAGVRRAPNDRQLRLSSLLLAPGEHIIGLEGQPGRWVLQAEALGPPRPGDEIEPNDDFAHAMALTPGEERQGRLDHYGDMDMYSFYLAVQERVRLVLRAPADTVVRADLGWGDTETPVARFFTPADGERTAVWDGLLPPGDYVIALRTNQRSDDPYSLTLELPPPFDRPTDLEPNDEPWQARSVPPDFHISGTLYEGDIDWYALPDLPQATKITATPKTAGGDLDLRVARLDAPPIAPGASTTTSTVTELTWDAATGVYTGLLPAGKGLLLRVSRATRPYDIVLTFDNGPPAKTSAPPNIELRLSLASNTVAAFIMEGQRIPGELTLANRGTTPLSLKLEPFVDDERWRVLPTRTEVALRPRERLTVPLVVEVAPDAWDGRAIRVALAARDAEGAAATAEATIVPQTGVPAAAPYVAWPLPDAMLGGLNVAWSALGGTSLDNHPTLIDGLTNEGGSAALDAGQTATVKLAGDEPIPLVGITLNTQGVPELRDRLRRFEIQTSEDGEHYTTVLTGTLSTRPMERAFSFSRPVRARFLRLVPIEAQGGPKASRFRLGELKAIADPAWKPPGAAFDLLRPELGGHVIWTTPQPQSDVTGESAAWPGPNPVPFPRAWTEAVEWVIGFRHSRAAQVVALEWTDGSRLDERERLQSVEVFAATETALGPWTPLGTWRLERDAGGVVRWRFDRPVWARYLRFRVTERPPMGVVYLPGAIAVRERTVDSEYRSILAEWGHDSTAAIYERLNASSPRPRPAVAAGTGHDKMSAAPLRLDEPVTGAVQLGVAEDWYQLEAPEGTREIRCTLSGQPHPEVTLFLEDAPGRPVVVTQDPRTPGLYRAAAGPGTYRLRVVDPPRSILLAWDTSTSVAAYVPTISRAIRSFARDVQPGREEVNLLPFGQGVPLLKTWSSGPVDTFAALQSYHWRDNSQMVSHRLWR